MNLPWFTANVLGFIIGFGLIHPGIAHGFAGEHGVQLTTAQLIAHIVSLLLSSLVYYFFTGWAIKQLGWQVKGPRLLMLIVLPQAAFWLGYYWLYIPFDVLFMSLTLGLINGLNLSGGFKRGGAWVAVSTLSALPGFATGALVTYPLNDWLVAQAYPPLLKDFAVWLSISANLGILYGLLSGAAAKRLAKVS